MPKSIVRWAYCLCLVWLCSLLPTSAWAQAAACRHHIDSVTAARADDTSTQAPAQGWEPVTLPDDWSRRWPGYDGVVWYRIVWTSDCPLDTVPAALTIDNIKMAGEVYSNHDLLWRDRHLQEPLSRSWTMSRYWILPQSSLHRQGENTIWVRVTGVAELSPGLGMTQLGAPDAMLSTHRQRDWSVRIVLWLNLTVSASLGLMALMVWLPQRKPPVMGWYALVSLFWVLFVCNALLTETWPFPNNQAMARANHLAYIGYIASFAVFCWHLMDQPLGRKPMRLLGGITLAGGAIIIVSPGWAPMQWVANLYTLIFIGNAAWVCRHALRSGNRQHALIASSLVFIVLLGVHDVLVMYGIWLGDVYGAYIGLLLLLMSAVVIRQRMLRDAKRIAHFNQELSETVERACEDLSTTLAQEHALALHNAQLQERLQLAQDLHDGLGGQIVRSIMLVEQSDAPPSKERYLSMLKLLRDDLRQVVDSDGSIGANAPATPEEWTIPLRYRFVSLFDDLDMRSEWLVPLRWKTPPTPLQCMLLARVAEEALTNTVKHSQARMVHVSLQYNDAEHLTLRIEDDGIGFDAPTALRAGLGIGMSSMRARMLRIGGNLQVQSRPGATTIEASLPLAGTPTAPAATALALSTPKVPAS